jgi:hypothetical protein
MADFWIISPDGKHVTAPHYTERKGACGWILCPQPEDPLAVTPCGTGTGTVVVEECEGDWGVRAVGPRLCVSSHSVLQGSRLVFWVHPNGSGRDSNVRVYWWVRGGADDARGTLRGLDRGAWALVVHTRDADGSSDTVRVAPGLCSRVLSTRHGRAVWAAALGAGWITGGGVPQGWDTDTIGGSGGGD